MIGTIGLIQNFFICFYGDFAHPGDGVPCINPEVGKDLIDLRGVDLDWLEVSAG